MERIVLHVAVVVLAAPGLAFCQERTQLHRIDAQTASGLSGLFQHDDRNRTGCEPDFKELKRLRLKDKDGSVR